ncbi:hypothetical protein LTR36_006962 [Oleoguttula mirabilis]|uniref:F-box protein n=1 Tax=Oleoguttula mirabilis TaxID=1507867 RepID=A0AAV9JBK7_9PEZI|nr:hypothetical protein LTR36_006962 [Oleoguttula mirabilis]
MAGGESDLEHEIREGDEMEMGADHLSEMSNVSGEPTHVPTPGQTAGAEPARQKAGEQRSSQAARPSTTLPRQHSTQSNGGAEPQADALGIRQSGHGVPPLVAPALPATPQLGNLHKRRASTSPEKFDTGRFEPLPLRIDTSGSTNGEPSAKRPRLENKIEISYDSCGTPRIASVTPTFALPSGRSIAVSQLLNRNRSTPTKPPFSIFNAFLRHNDVLLLLVSYLNIPSLLTLYSSSRSFHFIFNSQYMAFILSVMRTRAPDADRIYPWRCYKSLCVRDPSLHKKSSMAGQELKEQYDDLHEVPSLRWLQMVVWRQGVCKDMLIQLATKGLRCPRGTLDAVKRMWFILDLPFNAQRVALCQTEAYITQQTIFCATLFFLKVDMSFTDPAGPVYPVATANTNIGAHPRRLERTGVIGCDLREMLMAERHFTPLWRVLRGWSWDPSEPRVSMNRLDVLKLWVRHRYHLPEGVPEHVKKQSIMGVPWWEVGTAGLERPGVSHVNLGGKQVLLTNATNHQHDANQQMLYPHQKRIVLPRQKPREQLLRPEELMLRESIRRKLGLHTQWSRMMLWGFCDDLGRDLPVRTEEELLKWSHGKPPMHPFKSDEQVKRGMEEAKKKAAVTAAVGESGSAQRASGDATENE